MCARRLLLGVARVLLFPALAMKAPEQVLFDHRQFRSSDRIAMIASKVAVGDVMEFIHDHDL
jgi:hypothetical protein